MSELGTRKGKVLAISLSLAAVVVAVVAFSFATTPISRTPVALLNLVGAIVVFLVNVYAIYHITLLTRLGSKNWLSYAGVLGLLAAYDLVALVLFGLSFTKISFGALLAAHLFFTVAFLAIWFFWSAVKKRADVDRETVEVRRMVLADLRRSADEIYLRMGKIEKDCPEVVARFANLRDELRGLRDVDHADAPDLESRLGDRLRSIDYYLEILGSDADGEARKGFADSISNELRELERLLKLRKEAGVSSAS